MMLFKKIINVYTENSMKPIKRNVTLLIAKVDVAYNYWASKG
jgi:hypothetical protein